MQSKKIQFAFDKAAHTYDDYSLLQQHVGSTLVSFINPTTASIDIIDFGCGTGTTTLLLAQKYHYHYFDAVDLSPLSINLAKQKLSALNIKCRQGNFESLKNTKTQFDLIFSNMALQWCENLHNTFHLISGQLKKNGILAISLPLNDSLTELKNHYATHQLPCEKNIKRIIYQSGLILIKEEVLAYQLVFPSAYEALLSLKKTGAFATNNPAKSRSFKKSELLQKKIFVLNYRIGYYILGRHS